MQLLAIRPRKDWILGFLLVLLAVTFGEGGCGGGSSGTDEPDDIFFAIYSGEYAGVYAGAESGLWTMVADDTGRVWIGGLALDGRGVLRGQLETGGGFQASGYNVTATGVVNDDTVTGAWAASGGGAGTFSGELTLPTGGEFFDYAGAYAGDDPYTGQWSMIISHLGELFFGSARRPPGSGALQPGALFTVSDGEAGASGRIDVAGRVNGIWVLPDNSTRELRGESQFLIY